MPFLVFSFLLVFHPLHISVTEFTYSEKDKALQITSRIFIDDFESAIRIRNKMPELDILEPGNGMTTDKLALEYLTDHFKVKIDGKPRVFTILGHEKEDVAIIFYIEIPNVKKMKTLEVTNTTITELHDDQSNLVHVTYHGPIKSARLTKDNPTETYRFDVK